jgi:putative DNA methylase
MNSRSVLETSCHESKGNPARKTSNFRKNCCGSSVIANWDKSNSQVYLEAARGLVRAAHGGEAPLVTDPFGGGGSIPLEALRVGCDAFASDLNPVACLILRTLLEDIPRYGPSLADDLRRLGREIREAAEQELLEFYPLEKDGSKVIAYIWARSIIDNCRADVPLIRSLWLSKKSKKKRALRLIVHKERAKTPEISLEVFTPIKDSEVAAGTVSRAKASCPCCPLVMPPERVRIQLGRVHTIAKLVC